MADLVIVIKRAIPVSDCSTDTVTGIFPDTTTLKEVTDWINAECGGSTVFVSAEITIPTIGGNNRNT